MRVKLLRMRQYLSRKQNGSNRWEKYRLKIARLYQQITNQRNWFLYNCSTQLINNYNKIYIEIKNLAIEKVIKNHNFAKYIANVSLTKFISILEYKVLLYGKSVIKIDQFYPSSKTCKYGYVNTNMKLSGRVLVCESCGTINHRDLLTANNILKEGRSSLDDLTNTEVTKHVKCLELNCY